MHHRSIALVLLLPLFAGPLLAQATTDWVRAHALSPAINRGMVYDAVRQRLVLCGGSPETWERMAGTWIRRGRGWLGGTINYPNYPAVYDEARQRTVVLGFYSEHFEWDGAEWIQRTLALRPSPRQGHAMAYDAARQQVVLFGGEMANSGTRLGDTWIWDGVQWALTNPGSQPSPRAYGAMTYCAAQQRVVFFGGHDGPYFQETWEWDGITWTLRTPAMSPPPKDQPSFAYDELRQRAVLFGGWQVNILVNDTWEWDGANWMLMTPVASPQPLLNASMAYDGLMQRVVLHGGQLASEYLNETWEWDGANWTLVSGNTPDPGCGPGAFDRPRQQVVLFGDDNLYGLLGKTWLWDGVAWHRADPATNPALRAEHAMAEDAARQEVLLFGGRGSTGLLGDTWGWNGVDWTQRSPATSPSPRSAHAMACDQTRQRVVLFGGWSGTTRLNDTWEWDGVTWIPHPGTAPSARRDHAMAFDVSRQRTVLFGGNGATAASYQMADTWEWDGVTWQQRLPSNSASARASHCMAYDEGRQRIVIGGGYVNGGRDYWEWDGINWFPSPTANQPRFPMSNLIAWNVATMVYDAVRENVLMHTTSGETWLLEPVPAAPVDFGTGCAAAHAAPRLAVGEPFPGNPLFTIDLLTTTPNALCAIGVADQRANLPIGGGCSLLLQGTSGVLFGLTNAGGFASVHFAVAQIPALRGYAIHAQGFVLDPPGAVLDIAFSAGKTFLIGH